MDHTSFFSEATLIEIGVYEIHIFIIFLKSVINVFKKCGRLVCGSVVQSLGHLIALVFIETMAT